MQVGRRAQSEKSAATVVPSAKSERSLMGHRDGGERQRETRRRSILGLKQASAGSKEGLGAWKVLVLHIESCAMFFSLNARRGTGVRRPRINCVLVEGASAGHLHASCTAHEKRRFDLGCPHEGRSGRLELAPELILHPTSAF